MRLGWQLAQLVVRAMSAQFRNAGAVRQCQFRGQVQQGLQDEITVGQFRVGNGQARVVEGCLTKQQQIQIQGAWSPVPHSLTAVGLFNSLQAIQQFVGRKIGTQMNGTVNEIWLILRADGAAGIERRLRYQCGFG